MFFLKSGRKNQDENFRNSILMEISMILQAGNYKKLDYQQLKLSRVPNFLDSLSISRHGLMINEFANKIKRIF
ncbi:hypothetical protein BpHYR1_040110 [Brachionus plicatilis]|uniref:Uncharacterized protein n=1 Tax=Brachionus plicatilis TaxID=10195 RepID=A0A3M7P4X4_BRAPC|nr:hypothetical protein BpHYR1_040110 [Brachionus plicatilis]